MSAGENCAHGVEASSYCHECRIQASYQREAERVARALGRAQSSEVKSPRICGNEKCKLDHYGIEGRHPPLDCTHSAQDWYLSETDNRTSLRCSECERAPRQASREFDSENERELYAACAQLVLWAEGIPIAPGAFADDAAQAVEDGVTERAARALDAYGLPWREARK